MTNTKDEQALEIAVESALLLAAPATSIRDLAERIYQGEPRLMESFQRRWMVDHLVWLIRRRSKLVKPENQLRLPGFEKLPRRLTTQDGKRPRLGGATLPQLMDYRRYLVNRRDPRVKQLDALIELMKRHAPRSPTMTVSEVMAAEQEKLERE